MTRSDALRYAADWIEAWNRLDIEAVLATFQDGVAFASPRALATVGVGTVHGKEALRAYWVAALAEVSSLRFVLERTMWDPETHELAIVHVSEVNGSAKRVSENLRFGQDGKVDIVEVFHGVGGIEATQSKAKLGPVSARSPRSHPTIALVLCEQQGLV